MDSLPQEIIQTLFFYLDDDDVQNIAVVSKIFYVSINEDFLLAYLNDSDELPYGVNSWIKYRKNRYNAGISTLKLFSMLSFGKIFTGISYYPEDDYYGLHKSFNYFVLPHVTIEDFVSDLTEFNLNYHQLTKISKFAQGLCFNPDQHHLFFEGKIIMGDCGVINFYVGCFGHNTLYEHGGKNIDKRIKISKFSKSCFMTDVKVGFCVSGEHNECAINYGVWRSKYQSH